MTNDNETGTVILCPGQGAQAVGMGKAWRDASSAALAVFDEADAALDATLGAPLSRLCFEGPADELNRTNVCQPALYTAAVACWHALLEQHGETGRPLGIAAAAGLSLGEYTALHLAGAFSFADGLRLVALRGRLMQEAADASDGSMVALIGADEEAATTICERAVAGHDEVLVPANFNAPGQIVLSGHRAACERAAPIAVEMGFRATPLTVAGAFHSPLMQPAADRLAEGLASTPIEPPACPVWSNVTGKPHESGDVELLRQRLVQQVVRPVRWSQGCEDVIRGGYNDFRELAPGTVLRGLMRRIDRNTKVSSHDKPAETTV